MTGLITSDPVTFEVIRSGLYAICEEMKSVLMRTSFSPLLSLSADLSCAILDVTGNVAAQGNDIPVHLGAMPFTGRAALAAFPPATWEPGDAVLLNDPYVGGTHLPDMSMLTPVFHGDTLVAFAATRVHWPDVGGIAAGSSSIADEIIKEGLRVPPVKIISRGAIREDILRIILANVRIPDDRLGDFRAQQAANDRGVARVGALAARYGGETLVAALSESQRYSDLQVRARLARLPDADVDYAETLDGDGYAPAGDASLRLQVRIRKAGDRFDVDFTGTTGPARGPVNAPLPVTASAVYYTMLGFAGGSIPPNSGAYAAASITAPEGSLVHARYPAPVVAANTETSNRIVDLLLCALGQAYPEQVPAGGYGSACVYTFGGYDPVRARPFVHYETIGGGMGARRGAAGIGGLRVHMGNTMNLPIEAIEAALPVRFRAYELIEGSGGAGRWSGGEGVRKEIEMLAEVDASVLGERSHTRATGVAGGSPRACATFTVHGADGAGILASKSGPHRLRAGDRLEMRTAGGGGWGKPDIKEEPT
jgi:N-methylhydantoinase B